jgi:hypothetical protein
VENNEGFALSVGFIVKLHQGFIEIPAKLAFPETKVLGILRV